MGEVTAQEHFGSKNEWRRVTKITALIYSCSPIAASIFKEMNRRRQKKEFKNEKYLEFVEFMVKYFVEDKSTQNNKKKIIIK